MVDRTAIMKHMEVRASDGSRIGVVDEVEGERIKLTKNDSPDGQHHYVPLSDVTRVDEHVHLSTTRQAVYGAAAALGAAGAAGAAGMTGATASETADPLPHVLNRQVEGAKPRGNFYLPWILGAIGLLLLLLLLTRCFNHKEAVTPVETNTTQTETTMSTNDVVAATPTADVSGLGSYLGGNEGLPRTFTFGKLNFDTAKSDIRADDQAEIGQIASTLKQYANAKVKIVGYADARGAATANAMLGEHRADAVKAALVKAGIDGSRIATGTGVESTPVDTNATGAGQFENRRTELVVTSR